MSDLKRSIKCQLKIRTESMTLGTLMFYCLPFATEKDGRRFRRAIEELREAGEPIGSSARRGYFWIRTEKDWEEAVREFRAKAMSCLKMYQRLTKVGADMFSRQMGFEFSERLEQLKTEGERHGSESTGDTAQGAT